MGRHKFKLSDMMPSSWFYKLKDKSNSGGRRRRNQNITHSTKEKHQPTSSSISYSSLSSTLDQQPLQPVPQRLADKRKSYHFTRAADTATRDRLALCNHLAAKLRALDSRLSEPPRRSSRIRRRSTKRNRQNSIGQPPRILTSSVSGKCREVVEFVWTTPREYCIDFAHEDDQSLFPKCDYERDDLSPETFDAVACQCGVDNHEFNVIDMENKPFNSKVDEPEKQQVFDAVYGLDIPAPVITKYPGKFHDAAKDNNRKKSNEPENSKRISTAKEERKNTYQSFSVPCTREAKRNPTIRRSFPNSPGMKLRSNSPRIGNRTIPSRKSTSSTSSRKDLSKSFAVVKSSKDPHKDFKDSMVEMILENDISASKDLEDLLVCYLSLNSDEYHDLIIKVFKQIWFDRCNYIDPKLK